MDVKTDYEAYSTPVESVSGIRGDQMQYCIISSVCKNS